MPNAVFDNLLKYLYSKEQYMVTKQVRGIDTDDRTERKLFGRTEIKIKFSFENWDERMTYIYFSLLTLYITSGISP